MSNSRYEREYESFLPRRRTLRRRPQHAHFKRKGEIKYLATEMAGKKGSRSLPIEKRVEDRIAKSHHAGFYLVSLFWYLKIKNGSF